MFKNPYAQFVKFETNFTKQWSTGEKSTLVAHVGAGGIFSYGNSTYAPYTEQFSWVAPTVSAPSTPAR